MSAAEWKTMPFLIRDLAAHDAVERTPLYLTARPRSGQTWVRRLLSDVLNASTQHAPGEGAEWWGDHYDSGYVIRQNHTLDPLPGPTLYIYRDPRAVALSAMQYSRKATLYEFLTGRDGQLSLDAFPGWREYMETWLRASHREGQPLVYIVRYENLLLDSQWWLARICAQLTGGQFIAPDAVERAVARQQVDIVRARLQHQYGPDHNSVWRGRANTWRAYFDQRLGELFESAYGQWMHDLGYTRSHDWWRELPDTPEVQA